MPKNAKNCPKIVQKVPKIAQNCPKIAQNCPKLSKIERLPQQLYFPYCDPERSNRQDEMTG